MKQKMFFVIVYIRIMNRLVTSAMKNGKKGIFRFSWGWEKAVVSTKEIGVSGFVAKTDGKPSNKGIRSFLMKGKSIKRNVSKVLSLAMALAIASPVLGTAVSASAGNLADRLDSGKTYNSKFGSWQEYMNYAADLAVEIAGEGFVMLKNENDTLPLKDVKKVTVLGTAADSIVAGGGGSGAQSRPTSEANDLLPTSQVNVTDALKAAGFEINPQVEQVYQTVNSIQMPASGSFGRSNHREGGSYMTKVEEAAADTVEFAGNYYKANSESSLNAVEDSYNEYGDAAVVVIGRSGSEGADNPTNHVAGHTDPNEHYFELDDAEKEMMAYAKSHFEKVVVVINSPSAMELGCLDRDEDIGGVVWFGQPGFNGAFALGKILNGEVNPSGRLVDFYMEDFTTDPTWYNFGNYTQADIALNGESSGRTGTVDIGGNLNAIDYAEGIYVGYRYYETVAAELGDAGEEWYQEHTVYPFGFGLSYTSFSQEIVSIDGDLNKADGEVTVKVKVTNTGSVAGKDVVQLYVSKPYTVGGIDKAAVDLVEFGKTDMLKPGESETITLKTTVYDLSSFDYDDKNENDFCGWELETGDYVFSIRENSHKVIDEETLKCTTASKINGDDDDSTPNNIYSQSEGNWEQYNTLAHNWTESGEDHYLTRDQLVEDGEVYDLKQLAWLLTSDNSFSDKAITLGNSISRGYSYEDYDNALTEPVETDYENVWTKSADDIPSDWTQGAGELDADGNYDITLWEMRGVPFGDAKWTEFMNQMTWDELLSLVSANNGGSGYGNSALESINKPWINDSDGPAQLGDNGMEGMAWPVSVVISSTWNKDLAYKHGEAVGEESMYVSSNGWYGPSLNTHRSPFAGRNFEYYSQDGVQGGKMVAQVVKGAVDMGCHVYAKHAFLNDQETAREGTITFVTEQAIREIYAKQFELCVTEGNCNGFMNAFNRIGLNSSVSYATTVQLFENEWGFDGFSVTDFWSTSYAGRCGFTGWGMVRGMTTPLNRNRSSNGAGLWIDGVWNAEENMVYVPANADEVQSNTNSLASPTNWYWVRQTAQRLLYVTANNNGMANGLVDIDVSSELELTQYEAISQVNLLDAATRRAFMRFFGADGYEITRVSGLPSGLTYLGDGFVTGTPSRAGSSTVTFLVGGLGEKAYLKAQFMLTLTVADGDPANAPAVTPNAQITQSKVWTGTDVKAQIYATALGTTIPEIEAGAAANAANVGKFTAYSVSATGLPEGLTLDTETGKITGRPTVEAGSYEVNATVSYTQITASYDWWTGGYTYRATRTNARATITLTVIDGSMRDIEIIDGYWFLYGENTGYAVTGPAGQDGVDGLPGIDGLPGLNGANGENGATGETGATGATGETGANGKDGVGISKTEINDKGELVITYTDGTVANLGVIVPQTTEESGCGSSIAGASVACMAIAALAFVLRKKED